MKIQPIQQQYNYTQCNNQNVNFKGKFLPNEDLKAIMEYSSIGDLKRFKELVQMIKKVPDNLIFWVKSFYNFSDNGGSSSFVDLEKQIGKDKKTKKTLITMDSDYMPDDLFLSWINITLEQFYKNAIPMEDEDNIISEIEKLLTE